MVISKMEQVREEIAALKVKREELEQEIKQLEERDELTGLTEREAKKLDLRADRLKSIEEQITQLTTTFAQQTTILAEDKKQQTLLMASGPTGSNMMSSDGSGQGSAAIEESVQRGIEKAFRALGISRSPIIDSGTQTPNADVLPVSNASATVYLPFSQSPAVTTYNPYPTKKSAEEYYRELKDKFLEVNGDNRYSLMCSRNSYLIRDGQRTIFSTPKATHGIRNLLLEFHGSNYRVEEWLDKRANGEFNNEYYQSTPSP